MKILFLGDTHISERHGMGGAPSELGLADFKRAADQVVQWAREHRPDTIVHLGDLFDRARPTPREYMAAFEFVAPLAEVAPLMILEGNHDRDTSQNALDVIGELDGVMINQRPDRISVTTEADTRGVWIHTLPYPPSGARLLEQWHDKAGRNAELGTGLGFILEDMAAHARDDSTGAMHILAAHVTFAGSLYSETRSVGQWDLAVPTDALGYFDWTLAGHLHVRQPIPGGADRAHYVGPLTRWGFGDAGIPVGFAVLDTDIDELTWHDLEGGIDFVTLEAELDVRGYHANPQHIARVRGQLADAAAYHQACEQVDQVRDQWLHVRNDLEIAKAEGTLREARGDTVRDVFDAYVESRPDAVREDLRDEVVRYVDEIVREVRS